jgi:hypothetical protein
MTLRAQQVHCLDPLLGGTAQPVAQILRGPRGIVQGPLADEFLDHGSIIAGRAGWVKPIYLPGVLWFDSGRGRFKLMP